MKLRGQQLHGRRPERDYCIVNSASFVNISSLRQSREAMQTSNRLVSELLFRLSKQKKLVRAAHTAILKKRYM